MRTSRAISTLAILALVAGACGQQATGTPTTPTAAPATASAAPASAAPATQAPLAVENPRDGIVKPEPYPPEMFPLTQEKVTLRIAIPSNAVVEDFNTNWFTLWYEEKTNVHVEWIVLPASVSQDEALQSLNTMLATGDYPDVIMGFQNITPTLLQLYGQQGVFIPLNDLIDRLGANIKRAFAEYPDTADVITAPDGKIYGLPEINECYHCTMSQKLWLYKPWLDKLGMEMPTTTDELEQLLIAFKEKDPNGNGKADEIPLTRDVGGWMSNIDYYFMNSFLPNPETHRYVRDGKVDVTFNKPEWRDGLRYLHRLYTDGVLDPNSFTQDNAALMRIAQADPPIVGAVPWGCPCFLPLTDKPDRWTDFVVVPPVKGPNGVQISYVDPYEYLIPGKFIITKAAANPEVALRWADGFFQQEIELMANYGEKDVDWRWALPGEVGLNGTPALYAKLVPFANVQNKQWSQTNTSYRSSDYFLGVASTNPYDLEVILYNATKQLEPYASNTREVVPPLFFSTADAQEAGELEAQLTKTVDEMTARFIVGDADIETGWDAYLQTLGQIGLPRYLELVQNAYDAKSKQ